VQILFGLEIPEFAIYLYLFLHGNVRYLVDSISDYFAQAKELIVEFELPILQLRQVQQVVDQAVDHIGREISVLQEHFHLGRNIVLEELCEYGKVSIIDRDSLDSNIH
jgi:hypothetical protein